MLRYLTHGEKHSTPIHTFTVCDHTPFLSAYIYLYQNNMTSKQTSHTCIVSSYMTLIEVHEMHSRVHPN